MTRLLWDQLGERFFETGVDLGVFYPSNGGSGVPWNGLVSVNEAPEGGDASPYYLDGIKFLNIPNPEDYSGSIEAMGSPREFSNCDGMTSIGSVLLIGQQPRRSFGFSYRTKVGNDTQGEDFKYKIHIVYNLLVSPSSKSYSTISDTPEPIKFSWDFSTTPVFITGHKPSAHLVLDSDNEFINVIENILYGTDITAPRQPTPQEVINIINGD